MQAIDIEAPGKKTYVPLSEKQKGTLGERSVSYETRSKLCKVIFCVVISLGALIGVIIYYSSK